MNPKDDEDLDEVEIDHPIVVDDTIDHEAIDEETELDGMGTDK